MDFLNFQIDEYCKAHTDPEPDYLAEINRETHSKMMKPRMLSGHYQGRFLSMISQLKKPRNILEIGTFTGYSALCLAEGLHPDGNLYTIEVNEEFEELIRRNFEKSPKNDNIHLFIGNALDIIPNFNITFDLIFIDADKDNYLKYYELAIEKLNSGGLIISDNVLWSGKIVDEKQNDKTTQKLRAYNDYLCNDTRTKKVLLPMRDGIFLSMKI